MITVEITPKGDVVCAWFARCTNTTRRALEHPILGPVPCCDRCAGAAAVDLIDFDVEVISEIANGRNVPEPRVPLDGRPVEEDAPSQPSGRTLHQDGTPHPDPIPQRLRHCRKCGGEGYEFDDTGCIATLCAACHGEGVTS